MPFAAFPSDFRIMGPMMFRMALGLPVSYLATYEAAAASADPASRIDLSGFFGARPAFRRRSGRHGQAATAARNLAATNPRLEAVIYPGAGHLFSEDVAAAIGPSWKPMLGGTIEGNRQAQPRIGCFVARAPYRMAPLPHSGVDANAQDTPPFPLDTSPPPTTCCGSADHHGQMLRLSPRSHLLTGL